MNRDKWIPWYFVAFFAVIMLVDGAMGTIAVKTQTGVVTDHPYEKGLAYNRVVAAADTQQKLGWKGTIFFTASNAQSGTLAFELKDRNGKPIAPDSVNAAIYRPTQDGMDFSVTLAQPNQTVHFPAPGLWEVRIHAQHEGVDYQQSKRIMVE